MSYDGTGSLSYGEYRKAIEKGKPLTKGQIESIVEAAVQMGLQKDYKFKVPIMVLGHEKQKMDQMGADTPLDPFDPMVQLLGLQSGLPIGKYKFLEIVDHGVVGAVHCANGYTADGGRCNKELRWECRLEHEGTGKIFPIGRECVKHIFEEHPIIDTALEVLKGIENKVNNINRRKRLRDMIGDLLDTIHKIDPRHWFTREAGEWRTILRSGVRTPSSISYEKAQEFVDKWTPQELAKLASSVKQQIADYQSRYNTTITLPEYKDRPTRNQPIHQAKRGVRAHKNLAPQPSPQPQPSPAPQAPAPQPQAPMAFQQQQPADIAAKLGTLAQLEPFKGFDQSGVPHLVVKVKSVTPKLSGALEVGIEDCTGEEAVLALFAQEKTLDPQVGDVLKLEGCYCKVYKGNKQITSGKGRGTIKKIQSASPSQVQTVQVPVPAQTPEPEPEPEEEEEDDLEEQQMVETANRMEELLGLESESEPEEEEEEEESEEGDDEISHRIEVLGDDVVIEIGDIAEIMSPLKAIFIAQDILRALTEFHQE